jgi:hypothetical protein
MRARVSAAIDVLVGFALVAWVGGHAALGAFGARIAFQELPRVDAARTMTRVFHEFDRLVLVGALLIGVLGLVGLAVRPRRLASSVRTGLELGLCVLGLVEVFHVHAVIEGLFAAGETLGPAFRAAHRLSEKCAHGEVVLCLAWFVTQATLCYGRSGMVESARHEHPSGRP